MDSSASYLFILNQQVLAVSLSGGTCCTFTDDENLQQIYKFPTNILRYTKMKIQATHLFKNHSDSTTEVLQACRGRLLQ